MKFVLENERHHLARAIVQKVVEEGVPNAYAHVTHPLSTESEVHVECTSPLKRVLNGIDALRHDLQSVRLAAHALRPAPSS